MLLGSVWSVLYVVQISLDDDVAQAHLLVVKKSIPQGR